MYTGRATSTSFGKFHQMVRFSLSKSLFFVATVTSVWAAGTTARITGNINNGQLETLSGNVYPLARPEFDQGAAPSDLAMDHMLLVLTRSAAQEAALETLLKQQQDPTSPQYHKWLTPQEFGAQFGAADSDIQTITNWLESQGFTINQVSNGRTIIDFSGTAGQVQQAFHTQIHQYLINGVQHWANATNPQIPAALTPVIAGPATLHNFTKQPQLIHSNQTFEASVAAGVGPQFTESSGNYYLSPGDYAVIYNLNPLFNAGINGAGRTIAIVARSNIRVSDITDFRSTFGLPTNNPNVIVNGTNPGTSDTGDEEEAVLDTSWAGATAPGATVDLVVSESTNTTDGTDLSEMYIIDNNLADVMTESFGDCELDGYTQAQAISYSSLAEQAAAEGITYFVASGDSGAVGCASGSDNTSNGQLSVNILAANPYVVAVGGTEFNENGNYSAYWSSTNSSTGVSALSYIPEDVWNESCTVSTGVNPCPNGTSPGIYAGGGGASIFYSKPSWQTGITGIPNDGARDVPDVALTAAGHDPYLVCINGSCRPNSRGYISFSGYYGTSAATPSMAGITATILQEIGGRLGLINTTLYQIAATEALSDCNGSSQNGPPASNCVFHDVTVGNNSVPGEANYPNGRYSATAGYDLASGLGSVNAANLAIGLGACAGTPVLNVSTTSLSFGSDLGVPSTQQFTLSNTGNCNLIISPLSVSGSTEFAATLGCSTILLPNNTCMVTVTFIPTLPGVQSGTLTIVSNASTAIIALSGTGTPTTDAIISRSSLSFGSQKVVTRSAAQVITITNSTLEPLNPGSIAVSGVNPEDFVVGTNCDSTIASATSCTLYVVFTPLMAGSRSATISVPVASGGTQSTINLSGTGTLTGSFELFNVKTGQVLEVPGASLSNGTLIQQNVLSGAQQQEWELIPNADGSYTIYNPYTYGALDDTGGSMANGTLIQQYQPIAGDENQEWQLIPVDDVHYAIMNVNSKKVLDIPGGTTAPHSPVQQWQYNAGDEQQMWVLLPVGSYNITNDLSADVLDVVNASTATTAQIDQATPDGQHDQQWQLVPVGGGYYAIMNRNSGQALDDTGASTADGNLLQQFTYEPGDGNQQWQFIPVDSTNYEIVNRNSGKVLDNTGGSTTSGTLIQQWMYLGNSNQKWQLNPVTYYNIMNLKSGLVLDIPSGSAVNGTNIQQWFYDGAQQQQWQLVPVNNGYVVIVNNLTGKAIDDTGGSTANGTLVQEYQFLGDANQQWQFIAVTGGYYEIQNLNSGNVLDVIDGSTADGTLIQLYTYLGVSNQQWQLVPVGM